MAGLPETVVDCTPRTLPKNPAIMYVDRSKLTRTTRAIRKSKIKEGSVTCRHIQPRLAAPER